MIQKLLFLFVFTPCICLHGQLKNFEKKFELPEILNENSGLASVGNSLIIHNDSGNSNELFQINPNTGIIERIVQVQNAENYDWEDMAYDDDFLYIADIGNNNGNRDDLSILKISIAEFSSNTEVNAEFIRFTYEDQEDFNENLNNTAYDAEAICIYNGSILLFTKNWINLSTSLYQLSTDGGTQIAKKIASYAIDGLVTGVTINRDSNELMLCGHTNIYAPFLIRMSSFTDISSLVNAKTKYIELSPFIGSINQVEGITVMDGHYYLSNENVAINSIQIPPAVYAFDYNENTDEIHIFPNPTSELIHVISEEQPQSITLVNSLGKYIGELSFNGTHEVLLTGLEPGLYFAEILFPERKSVRKKILIK